MRIGNLDDLETSQHCNELADLINSEKELSVSEKWKNRWHYYKWYVVCGIILLGILCSIIGNALGIWKKYPDVQIAYVGKTALPPKTAAALENAFSSLEINVTVCISQYITDHQYADADAVYYDTVTELSLIGDIEDCESYIFLMDNPEDFQLEYQVLASPDGGCPDNSDYSVEDKTVLWSDCPALADITALVEEQASGSQEILSDLYLGRRCFYKETQTRNIDKCVNLWNYIIH